MRIEIATTVVLQFKSIKTWFRDIALKSVKKCCGTLLHRIAKYVEMNFERKGKEDRYVQFKPIRKHSLNFHSRMLLLISLEICFPIT